MYVWSSCCGRLLCIERKVYIYKQFYTRDLVELFPRSRGNDAKCSSMRAFGERRERRKRNVKTLFTRRPMCVSASLQHKYEFTLKKSQRGKYIRFLKGRLLDILPKTLSASLFIFRCGSLRCANRAHFNC